MAKPIITFPSFDESYKCSDTRGSMSPKQKEHENTHTYTMHTHHIPVYTNHNQTPENQWQRQKLKAIWGGKKHITERGSKLRIREDISSRAMLATRQ